MAFRTAPEPLSAIDFHFGRSLDAVRDFRANFELLDLSLSALF
jgi:hypothetical protein